MIKRLLFTGWIFLLAFPILRAQSKDSLALDFRFKFGDKPLVVGQEFVSKQNDTLKISTFRFYVSNIQLLYSDNSVAKINKSHLVDLEIPSSQKINLIPDSKKVINSVIFSVGVDSLSNVSGALSGDLDPAKGMYWAWQSGYVNMKIEGESPSCQTRKNQFQFHIGGYLKPNNALRVVRLNPENSSRFIIIDVDAAAFFSEVKLSETNSIMIPGKRAMQLADSSVKMFSIE